MNIYYNSQLFWSKKPGYQLFDAFSTAQLTNLSPPEADSHALPAAPGSRAGTSFAASYYGICGDGFTKNHQNL
jgi:hypothetical protein